MSGCSRSCGRRALSSCWALMAALASIATLNAPARAADIETRDYVVSVAGKPSGEVHMTIHRQDDGSINVRCDTDIKVNMVIGTYKFIYRGMEVWKDRRLVRFDSSTDDNGKRFIVSMQATQGGLRVKANNVEKTVTADAWLTSYWMLPDPKLRNQTLTILDCDNAKVLTAQLKYVATEKLKIANQQVTLNRYRLTGKVNMDLWYDGSERLVRQEWVEQGHKTIVELSRVRR